MRGFGAVQESIERTKERSNSYQSDTKRNFFTWKEDGDRRNLRFLDDMPYVVGLHSWTFCNDGKRRNFVCPESLDESEGFVRADCPICATYTRKSKDGAKEYPVKPTESTVGWAADRKVVVEGRQQIITDIEMEIEVDGQKKTLPWIGLVSQSNGNFWEYLMSYYARFGTVTDRDYEIVRKGKGLDTKYHAVPWDPTDDLQDQDAIDARYAESKKLVASPADYIKAFSSLEFINKYIVGKSSDVPDEREQTEAPVESDSNVASDNADEPTFHSLKDRLKHYSNSDS